MADLKALCAEAGFAAVRTYIASGNAILESRMSAPRIKATLESALEERLGKPIGVHVRSASELADVLARNPFPRKAPDRTMAVFLERALGSDARDEMRGWRKEEVRLSGRELFVHYPDGQGRSRLIIPQAKSGTARNMNTIAKLVELSGQR